MGVYESLKYAGGQTLSRGCSEELEHFLETGCTDVEVLWYALDWKLTPQGSAFWYSVAEGVTCLSEDEMRAELRRVFPGIDVIDEVEWE